MTDRPRIVVIDNYDSFVYIVVQYLAEIGAEPVVYRHDAIDVAGIRAVDPSGILISPGPGGPDDAGVSMEVIVELGGSVPILGVCLGMQCIGQAFGGIVTRAPDVMHGKTSLVHHRGTGVFAGLPDRFVATRYHSLVVDPSTLPPVLEVTAETGDGVIMGLAHRELDIEGVQFHPESVLTELGRELLANFVRRCPVGV